VSFLPSFLYCLLLWDFVLGVRDCVVVELLLIGLSGFWDLFIYLFFVGVVVCFGGGGGD
jgi:hypothetical protein